MSAESVPEEQTRRRLLCWQWLTLGALFIGYVGYYICRSNLAVATPQITGEEGILTATQLGDIVTIGTLLYAVGKISNGILVDVIGGRLLFLSGMFASVLCTVAMAVVGNYVTGAVFGAFAFLWGLNRFVQSTGWAALVQLSSRWFPPHRQGSAMTVLSMSFLVGDAAVRYYLGILIGMGLSWEELFLAAAGTLTGVALLVSLFLRSSPRVLGLDEPADVASSVYGNQDENKAGLGALLGPLLRSPAFWLICLLSAGFTLIRDTFNAWNVDYLTRTVGLSKEGAAKGSAIFPLVGAGAVLLAGPLVDWTGSKCGRIVAPSLVGLTLGLTCLVLVPLQGRGVLALGILGVVAFCLMVGYPLCAGVLALELGGKRGSSTASGFIDAAGYFGAAAAGSVVPRLVGWGGYTMVFQMLVAVSLVTLLAGCVFWMRQEWGRAH